MSQPVTPIQPTSKVPPQIEAVANPAPQPARLTAADGQQHVSPAEFGRSGTPGPPLTGELQQRSLLAPLAAGSEPLPLKGSVPPGGWQHRRPLAAPDSARSPIPPPSPLKLPSPMQALPCARQPAIERPPAQPCLTQAPSTSLPGYTPSLPPQLYLERQSPVSPPDGALAQATLVARQLLANTPPPVQPASTRCHTPWPCEQWAAQFSPSTPTAPGARQPSLGGEPPSPRCPLPQPSPTQQTQSSLEEVHALFLERRRRASA